MERRQIEADIAMTERHISLGERHIARQIEIIAKFRRDGHDTLEAERLLANFEVSQSLHIGHRDRLLKDLAESYR
jgi:hypothetical protein